MIVSTYSTSFRLHLNHGFDPKGAFLNWMTFADEICVAVGDDESMTILLAAVEETRAPVKLIRTEFDLSGADSFAYGKMENAAMQACTGGILVQQNLDERMSVTRERLEQLYIVLRDNPEIGAFWVPTMDLYGDVTRCTSEMCGKKWYISRPGYRRGAVSFGIKPDGKIDYDRSSSDELIDSAGNLVPTVSLLPDYTLSSIRPYAANGWPFVWHLGYLSLTDRAERAGWWSEFWLRATGGDPNGHITDVEVLKRRATVEHGLPLWPTIATP